MDGRGGRYVCGTKPGRLVVSREMPENLLSVSQMILDPTIIQVLSSEYGRALALVATRRLRFVFHAAGWLHFMVLQGRSSAFSWLVPTFSNYANLFVKKKNIRPTNTGSLKCHRLDFVVVRNAQIFRTHPSPSVSSPTSQTTPAIGVGRRERTSNSFRTQTTVPTVYPRINHHAT